MSETYTGGCACGAIRYEISAEPVVMNDCQCRQCQRESGTGHGASAIVVVQGLVLIARKIAELRIPAP
jgi:hypothetical protein